MSRQVKASDHPTQYFLAKDNKRDIVFIQVNLQVLKILPYIFGFSVFLRIPSISLLVLDRISWT